VCIHGARFEDIFASCSYTIQQRIHVGHNKVVPRSKLPEKLDFDEASNHIVLTLIQRARHFAAAARGGGARLSDGNPYSNKGIGDMIKRRKNPIIPVAISGKLTRP
jgi:hypothetical protein